MEIQRKGSKQIRSCFKRYGMQVRVAAAVLAAVAAIPLAARADWHTFEAGAKIVASEVNDNFKNLMMRLESFESSIFIDDATGNVAIGAQPPNQKLVVSDSKDDAVVSVLNTDAVNGYGLFIQAGGTAASRYIALFVDASRNTRMNVLANGNVGIGVGAPDELLTVAGDVKIRGSNRLHFSNTSDRSYIYAPSSDMLAFATAGAEAIRINTTGNVGIGLTNPAYKLDVNGQVRATNVSISSDLRLKRDIRPLTHALEGILCLQGVTYFLRDPLADQGLQYGLIAQEVERCYPELVSTDSDGYKSVSYDRLVAPLIEAVKEQQNALLEQQSINRELAAALAMTNTRLARLEALATRR